MVTCPKCRGAGLVHRYAIDGINTLYEMYCSLCSGRGQVEVVVAVTYRLEQ